MLLCCALLLGGCASSPARTADAGHDAPLNQMLEQAETARKAGNTDKALSLLHEASKAHPASELPWLRTAQIYFEQSNYGLAVVAAQEVLQRDNSDTAALSIIAVSGLRLSSITLEQLRKVNSVTGTTRVEAEALARTIRDALGDPGSRAANRAAAASSSASRRDSTAPAASAAPIAATAATSATPPAAASNTAPTAFSATPVARPVRPSAAPSLPPSPPPAPRGNRNPLDVLQ